MTPETPTSRDRAPIAVWRLHRFTRADSAAHSSSSLDADVDAFFSAVVDCVAGAGRWMPATAPARGGGIDVWFKIPLAPSDAAFGLVWTRLLNASGLKSQAISGRN